MNKHLKYLSYIVRHKWFVMLACFSRGLYWQGIKHDWSKLLPDEWFPYVEAFNGEFGYAFKESAHSHQSDIQRHERVMHEFDVAWLKHQHRNPHHWQHWVLRNDNGSTVALAMPAKYIGEMVSDWDGAGRAITGRAGGTLEWYLKNRERIVLHPETRRLVEYLLRA